MTTEDVHQINGYMCILYFILYELIRDHHIALSGRMGMGREEQCADTHPFALLINKRAQTIHVSISAIISQENVPVVIEAGHVGVVDDSKAYLLPFGIIYYSFVINV